MFKHLTFSDACDIYTDIRKFLPQLEEVLGQAGMECIVDALHVYSQEGHALKCCAFDEDFAHLFTLAYRDYSGYDLLPDFSCLTNWSGANYPVRCPNEPDN